MAIASAIPFGEFFKPNAAMPRVKPDEHSPGSRSPGGEYTTVLPQVEHNCLLTQGQHGSPCT